MSNNNITSQENDQNQNDNSQQVQEPVVTTPNIDWSHFELWE